MRKCCFSAMAWLALAFLMYCAADLVAKGQALNRLPPFPIFGYVLWALVVGLVWWLLVKPIFDFISLSRKSKISSRDRAKTLYRRLRSRIEQNKSNPDILPKEGWNAYARLEEAIRRKQWGTIDRFVEQCLAYDDVRSEGQRIVLSYSRAAALAVAFSRSPLIDGICMLVIQMKLVVALARLYGYRPSLVFNMCCFGWIAANSAVSTMLSRFSAGIADSAFVFDGDNGSDDGFGEALGEVAVGGVDDGFLLGAEAVGQRIASFTVGILLEAVMAGSAVYVTGRIFSAKLNGEWEKPTFMSYVKMRREGRREIGKGIPGMVKSLAANVGSIGKETVVSTYNHLHKMIFDAERQEQQDSDEARTKEN